MRQENMSIINDPQIPFGMQGVTNNIEAIAHEMRAVRVSDVRCQECDQHIGVVSESDLHHSVAVLFVCPACGETTPVTGDE